MFNIVKEQKDTVLIIKLSGSLDETVVFDQLMGAPGPEIHVYLKELKRINSIGVKTWIKYFQMAQKKGTKLKFFECSSAIVEQVNLISNFLCGGTVESVLVPFNCTQCKCELVGMFKTEDLKKIQYDVKDLKCSKCGGRAVFDDVPEEYFAFLSRTKED